MRNNMSKIVIGYKDHSYNRFFFYQSDGIYTSDIQDKLKTFRTTDAAVSFIDKHNLDAVKGYWHLVYQVSVKVDF